MQFSERLAGLLLERGLTQVRLARRLRTSQATVSRWLTGETQPRRRALQRLSEEFGVGLEWLANGEGLRSEKRILEYDTGKTGAVKAISKRADWRYAAGAKPGLRPMQYPTGVQQSIHLFVRDLRDDQLLAKMHETLDDPTLATSDLIVILRLLIDEFERRHTEAPSEVGSHESRRDIGDTTSKNTAV